MKKEKITAEKDIYAHKNKNVNAMTAKIFCFGHLRRLLRTSARLFSNSFYLLKKFKINAILA